MCEQSSHGFFWHVTMVLKIMALQKKGNTFFSFLLSTKISQSVSIQELYVSPSFPYLAFPDSFPLLKSCGHLIWCYFFVHRITQYSFSFYHEVFGGFFVTFGLGSYTSLIDWWQLRRTFWWAVHDAPSLKSIMCNKQYASCLKDKTQCRIRFIHAGFLNLQQACVKSLNVKVKSEGREDKMRWSSTFF